MSAYQLLWTPSHLQQVFSCLQTAFSRPGTICSLEDSVSHFTIEYSILACLVDHQVSFKDIGDRLPAVFKSLLAHQEADVETADFVLDRGEVSPVSTQYKLGSLSHPEMSSTLIVGIQDFNQADAAVRISLSGPGIQTNTQLVLNGLHVDWLHLRNRQCAAFPIGNDYIFYSERALMALPRSTKLEFDTI